MGNIVSGIKLAVFDNNTDNDQDRLLPNVLGDDSVRTLATNYGAINGPRVATSSASTSTAPQSQNPFAEVLELLDNIDEALSQTTETVIANEDTQTVQATVDIFRTLISELQNPFLTPEQYDKYYAALLLDKTKLDTFKLALNAAPDKNAFLKQQLKQQVLEKLQNIQNLQDSVSDASVQEEASASNNNDQDSLLQHEAVPVERPALDAVIDQFTSDNSQPADYQLEINLEKYTEYSKRVDDIEAEIKRLNPHVPIIDWKAKKVLRGGMLANLVVSSGLGIGAAILFFQAALRQLPTFCKLCEYEPSLESNNICDKNQPLQYVVTVYLFAAMASVINSILATGFFSKYLAKFVDWLKKVVSTPREAFNLDSIVAATFALATELIFLYIGGAFDSDFDVAIPVAISSIVNYPIDFMGAEYIVESGRKFYQRIRFGRPENEEIDQYLIPFIQTELSKALQQRVIKPTLQGQKNQFTDAALMKALALAKQHNDFSPLVDELLPDIDERIRVALKIERGSNDHWWLLVSIICAISQTGFLISGLQGMQAIIGGIPGIIVAIILGILATPSLPGLGAAASNDMRQYNDHTLLKLMHPQLDVLLKALLIIGAVGSAFTASMTCYDLVPSDSMGGYGASIVFMAAGWSGTTCINGIFTKGKIDTAIDYKFERDFIKKARPGIVEVVDTVNTLNGRVSELTGSSLTMFGNKDVRVAIPIIKLEQPAESLRLQ